MKFDDLELYTLVYIRLYAFLDIIILPVTFSKVSEKHCNFFNLANQSSRESSREFLSTFISLSLRRNKGEKNSFQLLSWTSLGTFQNYFDQVDGTPRGETATDRNVTENLPRTDDNVVEEGGRKKGIKKENKKRKKKEEDGTDVIWHGRDRTREFRAFRGAKCSKAIGDVESVQRCFLSTVSPPMGSPVSIPLSFNRRNVSFETFHAYTHERKRKSKRKKKKKKRKRKNRKEKKRVTILADRANQTSRNVPRSFRSSL